MAETKTRKVAKPKAPAITGDETPADRAIVAAQKPGSPAVNPETLIIEAVRKGDIALVERVLAVRRELKAEWAREQYFAALAEFQAECPVIGRTKTVKNSNGSERYRYTPIEEIVRVAGPILRKHGFSWTSKPEQTDTSVTVHVEAHHRDGHMEITTIKMPHDPAPGMNKSQATGSAFSYANRYAFKGAFGIQTADEDDDGASSGEEEPPPIAHAAPRKSQQEAPRDVTPKVETPAEPADRKLPAQLAGIKKVGEEAYWLLVDALKAKYVSHAYCETQGGRLSKNRGNEQFLSTLKVEIEAAIDKGRKEVA